LRALQKGRRPAALLSIRDIENKRLAKAFRGPYYILTAGDEHAAKRALRNLLSIMDRSADIQGVLNDLLPVWQAGRSSPVGGFESAWESYRAIPRYMILCAPRSGSEFLVRSLESAGIGSPREHIAARLTRAFRPVEGARPGALDFIYWFVTLIHHASINGVFGTKLISHVYRSLEAALNREEKHFLDEMMKQSLLVYLYRSNKLLQALSFDRALLTNFWHAYDPDRLPLYRETAGKWTYDYARIANGVHVLCTEERSAHELWHRHAGPHGLSACYESLDSDAVKQHILTSLKIAPLEQGPELTTSILRDEQTADYAQRFIAEYKQRYVAADPKTHMPIRITLEGKKLKIHTSPDSLDEA
jgi:LPS sulfotransferase NodH